MHTETRVALTHGTKVRMQNISTQQNDVLSTLPTITGRRAQLYISTAQRPRTRPPIPSRSIPRITTEMVHRITIRLY